MIPPDGNVIGTVGCGTAATEAVLVQQGRVVHGVDIAAQAIEKAKTRLSSARVVAADDRAVFPDASLDGLILADVIEHMPLAWESLAAYTKAVRPGGWVVISVPNMRNLKVLSRFIIGGDWPEDPTGIFDATHLQVMSKRRLVRWCSLAGLRIEKWYDLYLSNRWKQTTLQVLDALTLRLAHTWWLMELQLQARKQ
jgi:2-polyprenyl-3-methyl-5-hydroxy-6-metoxy-1,4-benzoquinol methylase